MLARFKSSTRSLTPIIILAAALPLAAESSIAQTPPITLTSAGAILQPAANYECRSLTRELKCISSEADDTAHLSDNPNAAVNAVDGTIEVAVAGAARLDDLVFYIADERSLLNSVHYRKLSVIKGMLKVPSSNARRVLIATNSQLPGRTKKKVVWLLSAQQLK